MGNLININQQTHIDMSDNGGEPKSATETKEEKKQEEPKEEKKHDVEYATDETKGVVDLAVVKTSTGEEGLECLMKFRVKLYRYRDDQWKERGIGNAKLLRDKESKRIRFLMRQ